MTTVTHECYVSLEVAKLLKEAGFDWEINSAYRDGKLVFQANHLNDNFNAKKYEIGAYEFFSAPTLYVAQRWLREVKGYLVSSVLCVNRKGNGNSFGFSVCSVLEDLSECRMIYPCNYYDEEDSKNFVKYENALEVGIKKALEIILEKEE